MSGKVTQGHGWSGKKVILCRSISVVAVSTRQGDTQEDIGVPTTALESSLPCSIENSIQAAQHLTDPTTAKMGEKTREEVGEAAK